MLLRQYFTTTCGSRRHRSTRTIGVALLGCALLAGTAGCSSPEVINSSSFHGEWPLTVSSVEVACGQKNTMSLGVTVAGKTYALNGTGKTFEGWYDLRGIWLDDPTNPGAKVSEGDLLDYVSTKCL